MVVTGEGIKPQLHDVEVAPGHLNFNITVPCLHIGPPGLNLNIVHLWPCLKQKNNIDIWVDGGLGCL